MNPILRYAWKPNARSIYEAADPDLGGNAGPCRMVDWAIRSGVPRSHCYEAIRDLVSYGAARSEDGPGGVSIHVLPEKFWDPSLATCSSEQFAEAYQLSGQARLPLATEAPSLNQALSEIRTTDRAERETTVGQSGASAPADRAERAEPERPVVRNPDNLASDQAQKPDVVRNPDNSETVAVRIPDKPPSPRSDRADRDPLIEKDSTSSRDPLEGTLERENSFPRLEGTRPELEPERRDRTWLMAKLHRIPQLEAEVLRPQTQDQQRTRRIFWEIEQRAPDVLAGYLGDLADRTDIRNKAAWFNASVTAWLAAHPAGRKRESERVGK